MVVEGVRDKIFYELIKLSFGSVAENDADEEDDVDDGEVDVKGNSTSWSWFDQSLKAPVNPISDIRSIQEVSDACIGYINQITGFIDDEAELDETAFDSDTGEIANVSEDEDEEKLAKRRKTDNGFIAEERKYIELIRFEINEILTGRIEAVRLKKHELIHCGFELRPSSFLAKK